MSTLSRPIAEGLNAAEPAAEPSDARNVVIESQSLFNGTSEVVIRHGQREYRLRRTRFDKLILTA